MIELDVNGRRHAVDAEGDTPLLYVLRDHLAMNGAKFGCGLGQCGACTVIVDGKAVFSCVTPISVLGEGFASSDAEIRRHMAPNLCRCGTHMRILRAIRRAAQRVPSAATPLRSTPT
jgi:nicotinate dehydrogenase subunit A